MLNETLNMTFNISNMNSIPDICLPTTELTNAQALQTILHSKIFEELINRLYLFSLISMLFVIGFFIITYNNKRAFMFFSKLQILILIISGLISNSIFSIVTIVKIMFNLENISIIIVYVLIYFVLFMIFIYYFIFTGEKLVKYIMEKIKLGVKKWQKEV